MKQLWVVLALLLVFPAAYADEDDSSSGDKKPTVKQRVSGLEEVTQQQQGQINQNSEDIAGLLGQPIIEEVVIMDSDIPPKAVGKVVSIEEEFVHVLLIIDDEFVVSRLNLNGMYPAYKQPYIYFDGANCTGQAYAAVGDNLFFNVFHSPTLITNEGSADQVINIYKKIGPFEYKSSIVSVLDWSLNCDPWAEDVFVAPVEQIGTEGLHELYPPPYTIEIQ